MDVGDFEPVRGASDLYVHDTGMYDTQGYGAVYVYDTPNPAVIDTGIGTNREAIFETLAEIGVGEEDLAWILPTHAHLDHAGGAGYFAERFPNAEVRIHERGVGHLVSPDRLVEGTKHAVGDQWRHYVEPKPVPEGRIEGLSGGETIDLGDRELDVVEAPGHAPHQTVFHEADEGVVFTADAAGIYIPETDSVRTTSPPPQFDLDQCLGDASAIADLDPELLCYPHFGPREYDGSLIEEMKRAYVEWVEAVRQGRADAESDDAVIEHFVETTQAAEFWNPERARADARLNARGVLRYLRERGDG